MKKYFAVSFKYSEDVFCTNIAHAETAEAVNAYYSAEYEWVSVRECEDYEVETARRKGMPIVEVETPEPEAPAEGPEQEEAQAKGFELIAQEVRKDATKRAEQVTANITQSDSCLKTYSTAKRWEQYQNDTITREKAVELATKRTQKDIDKDTIAKLAQIDRVANAPDLTFISVSVEWVRSSTYGHTPRVEVRTNTGTYYGTASGYDKESAAIAAAFNQCDSILKALYQLKENALQAGETEKKTSGGTRDNRNLCGYGSGYGAIPYFEGGVGASSFWHILEKCGFETHTHYSKHANFYEVEKKEG